ncbi:hypothetical protein QBC47DRAFT_24318 [Echria macrotheca]|uniref:Uncharacterized protein n=1 Tax=Echria macrotheca TaxID=438768 RepID=A0AAJ0BN53_9PEZI|nr:hypothetical protein QBC47DRAFT_24318 [Echria macrotheca]
MSGSGGFYKYRCKYFLTHDCNNWVYVNGAACAYCVADGRECMETEIAPAAPRFPRDIYVPQPCDGTLHYMLMEVVVEDGDGSNWYLRHKVSAEPLVKPIVTNIPGPVMAASGFHTHHGFPMNHGGY